MTDFWGCKLLIFGGRGGVNYRFSGGGSAGWGRGLFDKRSEDVAIKWCRVPISHRDRTFGLCLLTSLLALMKPAKSGEEILTSSLPASFRPPYPHLHTERIHLRPFNDEFITVVSLLAPRCRCSTDPSLLLLPPHSFCLGCSVYFWDSFFRGLPW